MRRFKKLCVVVGAISLIIFASSKMVFATEEYRLTLPLTEEYVNWENLREEEREEKLIPRISTIDISDDLVSRVNFVSNNSIREQILTGRLEMLDSKIVLDAVNGYNSSNYHLKDKINIEVKHQESTNECWAFSMTSVLETNLAVTKNMNKKFSIRHMDYSSIRTFLDGINSNGLNREAGQGGLAQFGLAYLTNGQGAVLDSYMPFEDNKNQINLSKLIQPVDTIVTDYIAFPSLYKQYDVDGKVTYTNGGTGSTLKVYTDEEVTAYRNMIKNHIYQYGGISAVTAGNYKAYYSNQAETSKSVAYFCNDNSKVRDHSITIVGWDDNYSRDNFTGVVKPYSNGAYICLNSYGAENFDNGYIYISYEDTLIESYLYGIVSTSNVDYDNLYQYNIFGENTSVGMSNLSKGYIAEIFSREESQNEETLKFVGVNIPSRMSLKIYVNPTGDNPTLENCQLVATTGVLEAGYHRIPIEATNLTGSKFAVMIEENTTNNRFDFSVEIAIDNSIYSMVQGNPGKCFYSTNGYGWNALSDEKIDGFDMQTCDLTIKAFTTEENGKTVTPIEPDNPETPTEPDTPETPTEPDTPETPTEPENPETPTEPENPETPTEPDISRDITISSNVYTIKDTYIYQIVHDTTIANFKNNIVTNSDIMEIYNSNDEKIEIDNSLIFSGMKVKLSDGKMYTLIVRGDLNSDGKISLIDLSKIVAHYGDESKYGLEGSALQSADMNVDGQISLKDISQLLEMLGNL